MKKSQTTEKNFEVEHIIKVLTDENNYLLRNSSDHFSHEYYLDTELLLRFIKETQPGEWEKHLENYENNSEDKFLERVSKELSSRGTLDVLRNGVKDRGVHFELAYFKPVSGLNPEHKAQYNANKFSVIRQLVYVKNSGKSLDIVLFLNGIPIITAELKNQFTDQDYTDAISQYRFDREPKEPLLERAMIHFAIDNDDVYFVTKLSGKNTKFLPFNKDVRNPDDKRGFKSAYIYHDIWDPDSLLDIIHNFMRVVEEENEFGRKKRKLIFPRYHQLDAVRRITNSAREKGTNKNYLIQHSTGSGKTYTISWLAHHFSQIYNNNERTFDTVVVVSDRKVIDRQLKDAIYDFEQTTGVVKHAEKSKDLRKALKKGKNIVVTTAQKFTYIVETIEKLEGSNFAVLIDEAHSGQGGKMSQAINKTFSYGSLEEAEEKDPKEKSLEDVVVESIKSKSKRDNVSYLAFTATPKQRTFEVFGEKNGKPFSLYSMKQAIKEGFVLNVLENYVSYRTYYKLAKKIKSDPEFSRRKATALLRTYVDLHKHAVKEKTSVILDHFFQNVKGEIGGKAKAMVVTKSRLHAVRYKLELDRQIVERGSNIKTLVAFTGTVKDGGNEYTEPRMNNGIPEEKTKEEFEKSKYRILVVASKYQTGFDQPLLQTMYVDKKLNGINAVQTLSRLNRTCPGKEYVSVLDFVNDAIEIQKSFEPYFDETILSEHIDPNDVYELESEIMNFQIIDKKEVNKFAKIWFDPKEDDQSLLHKALGPAVARYKELLSSKENESIKTDYTQERFRKLIKEFIKMYSLVIQVVKFEDVELEKLYQYCRFLLKKLPLEKDALPKEVINSVDMESFKIKKIYEGKIIPAEDDEGLEPIKPKKGKGIMDERDRLSEIIKKVNEVGGADELTEEDKVKVGQIAQTISENKKFQKSKEVNSRKDMRLLFAKLFEKTYSDMYDSDLDFYEKLEKNDEVREVLKEQLFDLVMNRKETNSKK